MDPDKTPTVPLKKKVPWWKKPWVWVVGGIATLALILFVEWIKNRLSVDQKELAKLRTKAEQGRIKAKNLEHQAKLEKNDEKAALIRKDVMLLRAKARKEITSIEVREKENAKKLEGLSKISSWAELDAINKKDR